MSSYFCHSTALCETKSVGSGTHIWAFSRVLPGAVIGRDCSICDHVFIENDVVVGDRVVIKCGVQLWDGLRVADEVFIGPNATFTNDRFPRSLHSPIEFLQTTLHSGCSIGAGAVVLPGLQIGPRAMVGAGAVVTRDVPPYAIVVGNPARIVGYQEVRQNTDEALAGNVELRGLTDTNVITGVSFVRFPKFRDLRGSLIPMEFSESFPFQPRRMFCVSEVTGQRIRGEHAHRECHQLLICVNGSIRVLIDNGKQRREVVLDTPQLGLHITPMVWASQRGFTADAVTVVLASHPYDSSDYIRSYDEFRRLMAADNNE